MGCANGKPIVRGSDCTSRHSQKANKKSRKRQRKPMRTFLRTLLFGNSKSSRIGPADIEISSTRPNSPPFNTTTSSSAERIHNIFCSSSGTTHIENVQEEVPVATGDHEETDSDSLTTVAEEEYHEESDETTDETEHIRNERYRARAIRNLEEVSTLKDTLKALERSQEEHEMELKLLEALKISALQSPQAESAHRLTKLNASVEKLSKTYNQYEKELYMVKGKRAIGEAKVDYFLMKLTPGMKYSDIYANNNSFYLFPIPEEDEHVEE